MKTEGQALPLGLSEVSAVDALAESKRVRLLKREIELPEEFGRVGLVGDRALFRISA